MPLNTFHRQIIDSAIDDLLQEFLTLPKEDAIAAIATLNNLSLMSGDEKAYPPLPDLFQKKVYQTKVVQYALRQLSEIMYNRQPQNELKYAEDQGAEINFGKFGLSKRDGEGIKVEDVRDYMQYKFALTAFNVVALQRAMTIANGWKRNKPNLFYQSFAQWSKQRELPPDMEKMLRANGILDTLTTKALRDELSQEHFKLFSAYLDLEEKEIKHSLNPSAINVKQITSQLLTLPKEVFDATMGPCFDGLFRGGVMSGGRYVPLHVLEKGPYQAVQQKLQEQIEKADPQFSELRGVIFSFIKAAEAQEYLNLYGAGIRLDDETLVNEVKHICAEYLTHLTTKPASEQKPLEEKQVNTLKEFFTRADEHINEQVLYDWTYDFFAGYFASERIDQSQLLAKMYHFALTEKRLCLDDQWLTAVHQERFNKTNGSVDISPYHANRVLLHALTTPFEQWTEIFYAVLDELLKVLNDPDHVHNLSPEALNKSSYPQAFREQLNWLRQTYYDQRLHTAKAGAQPRTTLPLLYHPQGCVDLISILTSLSTEQCQTVCPHLKDKLPTIIKDSFDFHYLLININDDKRTAIFENFKDNLPGMIKNADDLKHIFARLSVEQRTALYQGVQDRIPGMIESADDFRKALELLNVTQQTAVYERVKDKLPEIIKATSDFNNVLHHLSADQRTAVYELCKGNLHNCIKEPFDLGFAICNLNADQCKAVCERFKELIKQTADFLEVIGIQSTDNCKVICETLKDKLPELIKNADDFNNVLNGIDSDNPDRRTAIYENFKDKLPEIIKGTTDFGRVLVYLNDDQRTAVCKSVKDKLLASIQSHDALQEIFEIKKLLPDSDIKTNFFKQLLCVYLDIHLVNVSQLGLFSHSPTREDREAIAALKESMSSGKTIEQRHIAVLNQGDLGATINNYLTKYIPGVSVDQFLNQMLVVSAQQQLSR